MFHTDFLTRFGTPGKYFLHSRLREWIKLCLLTVWMMCKLLQLFRCHFKPVWGYNGKRGLNQGENQASSLWTIFCTTVITVTFIPVSQLLLFGNFFWIGVAWYKSITCTSLVGGPFVYFIRPDHWQAKV